MIKKRFTRKWISLVTGVSLEIKNNLPRRSNLIVFRTGNGTEMERDEEQRYR